MGIRVSIVLQELRNTVKPLDSAVFDQVFLDAYKDLAYGANFFDPSIAGRGFLLLSQAGRAAARRPEQVWKDVCTSFNLEEDEFRLVAELNRLCEKQVSQMPTLEWVPYPD